MSWNRARWAGLELLQERGIDDLEIAGGVEFDAWLHYSDEDPEWYTRSSDAYRVVFAPDSSETVLDTLSYPRWLQGQGHLYTTHVNAQPQH